MRTNLLSPYHTESNTESRLYITPPDPRHFLQALLAVIEDNFDEPFLTVGYLAGKMAMSKSTLNRKIAAFSSLSANELIRQCRLHKAAFFLASGKNVSETAYLTGFVTPSYFTYCFKEYYKMTPKAYAGSYRIDKQSQEFIYNFNPL